MDGKECPICGHFTPTDEQRQHDYPSDCIRSLASKVKELEERVYQNDYDVTGCSTRG